MTTTQSLSRALRAAARAPVTTIDRSQPSYFSKYRNIRFERSEDGILVMSLHNDGGPLTFTAQDHEAFVDAFYDVARDRGNKVVILTGAGGDFMPAIDFSSFGNVADPDVWSKVHDEGTQLLKNIANIRVPMIWALEGAAAANQAGFADQSHMTRAFVRQFGFTPGAWRRCSRRQTC